MSLAILRFFWQIAPLNLNHEKTLFLGQVTSATNGAFLMLHKPLAHALFMKNMKTFRIIGLTNQLLVLKSR